MLVTKQKVLRRFWYAIAPCDHVTNTPYPFRLLGEDIVLYRDGAGTPAALKDRCPHRTAKLSKGFVEGDNIVCGYHGWTYDRMGACVRIPQQEDGANQTNRVKVQNYHCQEKYGYIWVALEDPLTDIPSIPEETMPNVRRIFQFNEIWKTSSPRFMENAFDNSHFSYVHRNSFGQIDQPKPSKYELIENDWGFSAKTEVSIKNPPESHAVTGTSAPQTTRHLDNAYYLPFSRRFGCSYDSGIIHTIFNCATPIDDEHFLLTQWLYRNDTEQDCPAAGLIAFDRKVTDEDKEILEATDPDVCIDVTRQQEMHMPSDKPGLIIRKQLLDLLRNHGEEEIHAGNVGDFLTSNHQG